ncbi:MAG: GNAT family N-acetyltransferase [Pseudomonadota bacterium]
MPASADPGLIGQGEIVLETERLALRAIADGDAVVQDRVLNTPAVMAHLGGVKELHEIEAKHTKSMALFKLRGFSFLMVIERTSGELVGHAGLKLVDHPCAPNVGDHEIGWLLREDRWRRGYAYEAMVAVIDWAFGRVGAPYVVALTSARNVGSWKLMQKLAMERRQDLDFTDPAFPDSDNPVIQYALRREAWESRP